MNKRGKYNPNLSREIEIIDVILISVIILLSFISILSYSVYQIEISDQILSYGKIGIFITTVFLEFIPQFLTPFFIPLVGISSGISLGSALLFSILGSIVGSLLGFEFGRHYGWSIILSLVKKKTAESVFSFWNKYGKLFVFVSAITPLPYVPLIFGALNMSRKDFWIFGILPRVLGFIVFVLGSYYGFFQFL